ncbi:hypothetical protein [Natronosalvus amylolyticus]|uniref:hypothetical protein n=1 Tax=Natronosalvus amylolyticus TaxID=2961994 RepID=UPI0020C96AD2|nr:hypothetical protein [Natronosalvus amylolyticus]
MLSKYGMIAISLIVALGFGIAWYKISIDKYRGRYSESATQIAGSESFAMAYLAILALGQAVGVYGLYEGVHPINDYTELYALAAVAAFGAIVAYEYKRWNLSERFVAPSTVITPVFTLVLSIVQHQTGIILGLPTEVIIALLPAYWLLARVMFDDRDPDL